MTANPTGCTFGRFVACDEDLQGGFLPVFWDVPRANLHAVVDIGAVVDWLQFQFTYFRDAKSSLAVLLKMTWSPTSRPVAGCLKPKALLSRGELQLVQE